MRPKKIAKKNKGLMGSHLDNITQPLTRISLLRDLYAHMLLTRLVDEYAYQAYQRNCLGFVASCRGHEAAQVGSAACIKVGRDFTLPYYRDLGVVLMVGMTPYEVFLSYLENHRQAENSCLAREPVTHWGYHKHNLVTGPAPVATQIMHAAGIAFACKLRQAAAVTVAYCGDGATAEPDFLEGVAFAVQHQLPAIFICEQASAVSQSSPLAALPLPPGLAHRYLDGNDALVVYTAMQEALHHARAGQGPVLLEMRVTRLAPGEKTGDVAHDPLLRCKQLLQEQDGWDASWARELERRLRDEVERTLDDVLRNTHTGFREKEDQDNP